MRLSVMSYSGVTLLLPRIIGFYKCMCMFEYVCQVQMVVDWLDWVGLRYAINSTSRSIVDGECRNRLLAWLWLSVTWWSKNGVFLSCILYRLLVWHLQQVDTTTLPIRDGVVEWRWLCVSSFWEKCGMIMIGGCSSQMMHYIYRQSSDGHTAGFQLWFVRVHGHWVLE